MANRMPDSSQRAKQVFIELIREVRAEDWDRQLDERCAHDPELRERVRALLRAHREPGSFLDQPALLPGSDLTVDHSPTETLGDQIGPYKLVEKIGEGGMGVVYLATQSEPVRRKVALKVIKPGMDSRQVVARFEAERQALALMNHPNIAKVLDGGSTSERKDEGGSRQDDGSETDATDKRSGSSCSSGRPYFVMELVQGTPITAYCDARRLTTHERLALFVAVCQAVQHAHQKGIIHRDLKPSNVLVEVEDGPGARGVPKVIDFGVAKATGVQLTDDAPVTGFAQWIGTPMYMSPEQAGQNPGAPGDIDTRSDIYSLGVMLYELLSGHTPFDDAVLRGAGVDEMRRIIREDEPPRPSTRLSSLGVADQSTITSVRRTDVQSLCRQLRGELDWIVMKCLEKDRSRRYESASALAADLQRYLNDEPVEARPPSTAYRLGKFARRNKAAFTATAVVFVALVAGVSGTTWGLIEARHQERIARGEAKSADRARKAERAARHREKKRADAERKANAAAQEQRNVAVAVQNFLLRDLLAQADPSMQAWSMLDAGASELDRMVANPRILELLDRAAEALAPDKIESKFPDLPLVQAQLLSTLGSAYQGAQAYEKAIVYLTRAATMFQSQLGPHDRLTLSTLGMLAGAYRAAGKSSEARRLAEQVRDAQVKSLGADDQDTLTTSKILGMAYLDSGMIPRAVELFEALRATHLRIHGASHENTLDVMNGLAMAYQSAGQVREAIDLLERTYAAELKTPGADHPHTLNTLYLLASAYLRAGRREEAIEHFQRVREGRTRIYGKHHLATLRASEALASAYFTTGKLNDAASVLEELREGLTTLLGPDDSFTLTTIYNLACTYRDVGRLDDAIKTFEFVRDARVRIDGPQDPETLRVLQGLVRTYLAANKLDQAISLGEEVRKTQSETIGPEDPDTLATLSILGLAYRAAGNFDMAVECAEQAAGGFEKLTFDPSGAQSVVTDAITVFVAARRFDRGEYWSRKLVDLIKRKQGTQSDDYPGSLATLAVNLVKQQKWLEAEMVLRECLAIRLQRQPEAWTTFNTQSLLGGALLGQGKLDEAEPLLVDGYEGMQAREATIPPAAKNRLADALQRVMTLYETWRKPEQAAEWRKKLPPSDRAPEPPAAEPAKSAEPSQK